MKYPILCLGLVFLSPFAHAQEQLDNASVQALGQTQSLMVSPSERQKAIDTDAKAKQADDKVRDVASSPEDQQKMYEISADIFKNVVNNSGGDVDKQKAMMERASQDPEAFFNSLSPEQQAQIKALAAKIEGEHPNIGNSP